MGRGTRPTTSLTVSFRHAPPTTHHPSSSPRRGITLLEVLVSVFVLSLGMLGLASLIPVSRFQMVEASKVDRGSSTGRSALRDLRVRGYLNPASWLGAPYSATTGFPLVMTTPGPNYGKLLPLPPPMSPAGTAPPKPPYVIDPLSIAYHQQNGLTPPVNFPVTGIAGAPSVQRLTVARTDVTNINPIVNPPPYLTLTYAAAEQIFTSNDDLVYTVPKDGDPNATPGSSSLNRPAGASTWTVGADGAWGAAGTDDDANGVTDDSSEAGHPGPDGVYGTADDTDDRLLRNFAGDVTWLATISPVTSEMVGATGNALQSRMFNVSVAVFYKRDYVVDTSGTPSAPPTPSERMVLADIEGGGEGGGDVLLRTTGPATWLDVKPGDWMMLTAVMRDPTLDAWYASYGVGGGQGQQTVLRWYRVASVDEGPRAGTGPMAGQFGRHVTLAGPDWPIAVSGGLPIFNDADGGATVAPTAFATLITGVVGVYEQTMKLEGASTWSD